MSGKIISLIFALVMLCVPAAAVQVSNEVTVHNGDVHTASEVTVYEGDFYTVIIYENPSTGYKWTVTSSSGLKLLSDKFIPSNTGLLGSGGERKLMFLADQKGEQTIAAEYRRSSEEKPAQTSKFVLNVI